MSVTCEQIGSDDEMLQAVSRTKTNDKDSYEEEELDYEEEMEDPKSHNNNVKSEEDGELSDEEDNNILQQPPANNNKNSMSKEKGSIEKDEGELDDEDLEEGEVKEDDEEEEQSTFARDNNDEKVDFIKDNERSKNYQQENRSYSRHDNVQRHSHWSNNNSSQNYSSSRYNNYRSDRGYTTNRNREHYNNHNAHQHSSSESAWERGLKQARELLSKASKRKEEDVDFDHKRFHMSMDNTQQVDQPKPLSSRERSPSKRRRHSSNHHSSSEDEVERRHRLAYDAAPWNNNNQSNNYRSSGGRANNNYLSNRSAETYRDPWRRSKSPRPTASSQSQQQRGSRRTNDVDTRYGEIYKREDKIHPEPRRSDSMSSLSSIGSNTSNISATERSPGRKLPYSRPNLESSSRYERENELASRSDYPRSRMDRIPKKSNVLPHYQSNDVSETKSFDSWSESLSESDSSSFYSNSDSSDDSDVEKSAHNKSISSNRLKANKQPDKRSQANLSAKSNSTSINSKQSHSSSSSRPRQLAKDVHISKASIGTSKSSRSNTEVEKKPPIKMTFMKTQTSLKKDRLVDEQLNGGEPFELDDLEASNSRMSHFSGKSANSKSQSEDEEQKISVMRTHKDSSSSSSSSSSTNNKIDRREELLLKLKAVEEAIERKLNSKKD